jgi:4-diphosphocytidyl-2-C-methyl-D-erythritol kinase
MTPYERIELKAPAKINLILRVVGRRPDGYHLLETLMAKLDLADDLILESGPEGFELTVDGADLPVDQGNLCTRAAMAFFQASGRPAKVRARLVKRIPVAAGLGGGSSDAAAMLLSLNRMYGRPLDETRLHALGLQLGADVPFFLYPRATAWAEGIGERLGPGPNLGNELILLVNPGWPLSTAWVFRNHKLELTSGGRKTIVTGLNERSFTMLGALHNDLERTVLAHYPSLAGIRAALLDEGARGALMSGSGPTLFGVFSDPDVRHRAAEKLRALGGGRWRVVEAAILNMAVTDGQLQQSF